jgi:pimeloyl-ACP methyl ester carboxylesterase
MIESTREHLGWVLHESGPERADHTVFLLPGALCTAAFYDDLLAEPSMSEAPIRFVATTVPGFGGTAPPEDMSMESYSKLAGQLASDLGCDAVVGHSLGANIAIEMASAVEFSGPLVLLSPSFSRRDESRFRARSIVSVGYSGTCPIR